MEKLIYVAVPLQHNTGMEDANGTPIHVNDKVIKGWGGFFHNKKHYITYQWHTIKMEAVANKITFLLGPIHNEWEGDSVIVLDDKLMKELEEAGIHEGKKFYINDDGEPKIPTSAQLYGCSEEEADKLDSDFENALTTALWGKQAPSTKA